MQPHISVIAFVVFSQYVINAQNQYFVQPGPEECGKLNEKDFYSEKNITALDEFPWIGRLGFKDLATEATVQHCLATLISQRYVVTNAQCFSDSKRYQPLHVILGDWDSSNEITQQDCDENNQCAPLPAVYELEDIGFHPQFDDIAKNNDIALIRLTKDVEFNDYVRPICMPPSEVKNSRFVAQYLTYSGFQRRDVKNRQRLKALGHVRSLPSCRNYYKFNIAENYICASCSTALNLQAGSVLMGVRSEDSGPRNYYLAGITSFGRNLCTPTSPDVILRIGPYLEWIDDNIV